MCKRVRSLAAGFFGGLLAVGVVLAAQGITIPNTFTNGTVADATQVNANFTALAANALNRAAGIFSGNATPDVDDTRDLGTNALRFANVRAHHFGGTGADFTGDGSALTGITTVPSGAIFFFNGACPTGYTEFTNARGRYIVGLVSGGTLNTGVGTVLTDQENRPVGQHNHTATDSGHVHNFGYADGTGHNNGSGSIVGSDASLSDTILKNTNTSTANITVANSGAVAGTNAPYLQLRACQKS